MRKAQKNGGSRTPEPAQKPRPTARAATQSATSLSLALNPRDLAVADHPPPFPVASGELEGALGAGEPVSPGVALALREQFGRDFSGVRIHADAQGDHVARSLGADALAFGERIAFRHGRYAPGTPRGDALLMHEAGHLAAGRNPGGTRSGSPVQLQVSVDDVASEMVGMTFLVRSDQGAPPNQIPAGARVTVVAWPTTGAQARVRYTVGRRTVTLSVPKLALRPDITPVPGVRRYSVGIGAQQTGVVDRQMAVATAMGQMAALDRRRGAFRANPLEWQRQMTVLRAEVQRLEGLAGQAQLELSRMLVRSTMYNRFDAVIVQWVNHYNRLLHPADPLDPNVVKSLLFRETRMGTSGAHLERGPYSWSNPQQHPVRSRYNLGQAIDSSAHQQLLMIEEMAPAIYTQFNLRDLERERVRRGLNNDQMLAWNGGALMRAMRTFFTQRDRGTGQNLMGTAGRDLHMDYAFWIRTAIRWLFLKYLTLPRPPSWPEAIRAYNGAGSAAQNYRNDVMGRVNRPGTGDIPVGND